MLLNQLVAEQFPRDGSLSPSCGPGAAGPGDADARLFRRALCGIKPSAPHRCTRYIRFQPGRTLERLRSPELAESPHLNVIVGALFQRPLKEALQQRAIDLGLREAAGKQALHARAALDHPVKVRRAHRHKHDLIAHALFAVDDDLALLLSIPARQAKVTLGFRPRFGADARRIARPGFLPTPHVQQRERPVVR